jgi:hypothetical protein
MGAVVDDQSSRGGPGSRSRTETNNNPGCWFAVVVGGGKLMPWRSPLPLNLKFKPWPTPGPPKVHTIDPKTGILPMSEWGAECARGFVSNAHFARAGEKVIPRKVHKK